MNAETYHRSFARIDLDVIRANFDELKRRTADGVKTMAVVKANGYGHGAVRVAKALEDRADYFAVATLEEAVELRDNGITKPVMVLSFTHPSQYDTLVQRDIIATLCSLEEAEQLSVVAERHGKTATVHIGVETGMNRIGLPDTDDGVEDIRRITALPHVTAEGIFTHFACADATDKTAALRQKERFDRFLALLDEAGVHIPIKHCCNSAATIDFDAHYDMVRLGIALYGMAPSNEVMFDRVALKPAMQVFTHVIYVKDVEAGYGIGYGHTYHTSEKRRIATISIGYADGYNRAFSNRGHVLIHGKKAPIVGRICMDMAMVDVTDIPETQVGDEVVVMGTSGEERITAEDLGALCMSFNYEVVCTFMPRVARVYSE